MKLISASRRTDIPAFYSRWFLRRLAEGFCEWVNPFSGQVLRVSLLPQDTLGIVCWTRNPAPLATSLDALQQAGHRLAFHFTINGYPGALESHNPPVEAAVRAFRDLARRLPAGRAWWRYDPILLTDATPPAWHERNFARLAEELEGQTGRCYFSFASFYRKTRRNLAASGVPWQEPAIGEKLELAGRLNLIARRHGIGMFSCCDDRLLAAGVEKAHCVEPGAFSQAPSGIKLAPTRAGCGCTQSVDIGAYDTCAFGCAYCYATASRRAALARLARHDPNDTALWRPKPTAGPPATEPAAGEV
ncbi:MAG: DUF1848 domain-containing protein [Bryobacterales bacterium]|nr:DUF1848 domain-containing protein [Bryobacterales bacterium]